MDYIVNNSKAETECSHMKSEYLENNIHQVKGNVADYSGRAV
jgi:hypothetical protein